MKQQRYTGKGIGVALLDTGIYPHMDFDDRITGFCDFISHKKQIYDDNGHGTCVAGILGGSGAASYGKYKGVAPECTLVALKVLDRFGNGNKENVLKAFRWILDHRKEYHIRVVNISVGTTYRTRNDHDVLVEGVEKLLGRRSGGSGCCRKSGTGTRQCDSSRMQQKSNYCRFQ